MFLLCCRPTTKSFLKAGYAHKPMSVAHFTICGDTAAQGGEASVMPTIFPLNAGDSDDGESGKSSMKPTNKSRKRGRTSSGVLRPEASSSDAGVSERLIDLLESQTKAQEAYEAAAAARQDRMLDLFSSLVSSIKKS